ncbi:MAG: hypothetical protein JW774_11545, partial [Candidatus Aureabacteria bacterium]|nr:hypothetical protein [Candidatus Auribacterota bacterium]
MGTILQYIVQGMSQNPDLQYMTVQDYIGSVFAQMINGLEHLHNAQNAEDSPYNTFGLYLRHFLSATSNMVMENTNGYRHYLSRQLGLIQTPVQGEEPARYVRVAYDMWKGNNTGDPSVEDILVTLNIIRESGADIHALVRASMVLESPASTADSESYRTYYSAVSSAVVKAFSGIRAASGTISVDESASSQRLVAGAA